MTIFLPKTWCTHLSSVVKLDTVERLVVQHELTSCALQDSGTTATVVVLCGSHVMTANVGDSLAYADLGTRVQQLTSNHRIDENTSEQRRIESSGERPLRECLVLVPP